MTNSTFQSEYIHSGVDLPIFKYPSAVLKKVADEVTDFNEELERLAKNMLFTMYNAPGIGLAAPQVGVSKRIFCIDIEFSREKITAADGSSNYKYRNFSPIVLINPVITSLSGEILWQEGCLSFPGIYEDIKRSESIIVDYQDIRGDSHTIEADEMMAICIQHELDHLDGIVFIERLSHLKRTLLLKKLNKKKKKGKIND